MKKNEGKRFKKIAFIAGTLGTGGAERQLFYLLRNLKNAGYDPFVICLTKNEFWEGQIREFGIKVIYAGRSNSRVRRFLSIFNIIRIEKPEIIYSFHFFCNLYAGLCGRLQNITSLGSIRSNGIQEKNNHRELGWLQYAFPKYIITNSEHGKRNIANVFYNKPIYVLQNAIDLNIFHFFIQPLKINLKIIYIGRFENAKQPWLFPEFIKLLNKNGVKCHGEMYGDGSLKETVLLSIKEKYFDYDIRVYPSNPTIQEIYKTADCLVLVSKHEGTPNVILEAMASGIPVAVLQMEGIETGISRILPRKFSAKNRSLVNVRPKQRKYDTSSTFKNRN